MLWLWGSWRGRRAGRRVFRPRAAHYGTVRPRWEYRPARTRRAAPSALYCRPMTTQPTSPAPEEAPSRSREGLTLLGNGRTRYPSDYDPALLESFANRHPDLDTMVTLRCPEFTTLCPITGQPDFGELVIRYVPAERLVESKSLKLYLFSFRNHGDFHEDVCNVVLKDLRALLRPKYIEVLGLFRPRGGIAIHPLVAWAPEDGPYAAKARRRLVEAPGAGAPAS